MVVEDPSASICSEHRLKMEEAANSSIKEPLDLVKLALGEYVPFSELE